MSSDRAAGTTRKTAAPRQRRAVETRDGLLATVESIVAKEGADAVTTTRVALESGVAVGTIYRYFEDRDAMLLAAYDATVVRVVDICHQALEALPEAVPVETAARNLLGIYLEAAESIPAHAGLLAAMRHLRPVEAGQSANEDRIVSELVAPFLARFVPAAARDGMRMHLMSLVIGTLVDLYLVTGDTEDRAMLRGELEAYVLFMVERALQAARDPAG
jgi:AcrR family transcriptional regulator